MQTVEHVVHNEIENAKRRVEKRRKLRVLLTQEGFYDLSGAVTGLSETQVNELTILIRGYFI